MRLVRYTAARCLRAVVLLTGVSIFSFGLLELAPGDYFDEIRLNPSISTGTLAELRQQYSLDQPVVVRYAGWLRSVVNGEWGFSVVYQCPAGPLIWERARNTLLLTGTATIAGWLLAMAVAIWAAAGRAWRGVLLVGTVSLLMAVPDILLIFVLILAAAQTEWLPAGGMTSIGYSGMTIPGKYKDIAFHLVLPATALALSIVPALIAHTQAALTDVMAAPFILSARGHGIPRLRLLLRQALPVAANPLITLAGYSTGTLLSAGLLVETITGWPGLGQLLWQSILQRDHYVVIGAVMLSAVLLAAGNLAADVALQVFDPRIRTEQ